MPRPVTVTASFTFPLTFGGKCAAELECCATARVKPGEAARPWHDDPGCGPEIVSDFTDIMVDCGGYDKDFKGWKCDWVEPDADMTKRIKAWLHEGHADADFGEAADEQGGPDPDMVREMRRETA